MYHDVRKSFIISAIKALLKSDAKRAVVYYIGHGVRTYTSQSHLEKSGKDSALYSLDGMVVDNELRKIIDDTRRSGRQVTFISDCCHSGSMYDLASNDFLEYDIMSIGACGDMQTAKQDYICRRGNGVFSYYFWKYYTHEIPFAELIERVNSKLAVYRQKCETSIDDLLFMNKTFKVL
jgi:hypothetical protein